MLIHAAALAIALCSPETAVALRPTHIQTQAIAGLSVAEMMEATSLDMVFTHFGAAIEAQPHEQGAPFGTLLAGAWSDAAREVFDARSMHAALAASLEGKFGAQEQAVLAGFFRSEFGRRMTRLERAVQMLEPQEQLAARFAGQALMDAIPVGSRRDRQYEEMMALVSADIAGIMVGQSVRGMLIGMSLAQQRGDIEVPWEEIDLRIAEMLPALKADVAATQRAMIAYAYRDLTEDELETYLQFLRTAPAQKFYALALYSVGRIVTDTMTTFGETLARRMGMVRV